MITLNTLKKYAKLQNKNKAASAEAVAVVEHLPSREPPSAMPETAIQRRFYVSTSLDAVWLDVPSSWDKRQPWHDEEGKAYHMLTPKMFAWLYAHMSMAQVAFKRGKLADADWEMARSRFKVVHDEAITMYGRDTLNKAVSIQTRCPSKAFSPIRGDNNLETQEKGSQAKVHARYADTKKLLAEALKVCPFDDGYLQNAALRMPHLVPCPRTHPAWWWVEKRWCDIKCQGDRHCILPLYWGGVLPAEGSSYVN